MQVRQIMTKGGRFIEHGESVTRVAWPARLCCRLDAQEQCGAAWFPQDATERVLIGAATYRESTGADSPVH